MCCELTHLNVKLNYETTSTIIYDSQYSDCTVHKRQIFSDSKRKGWVMESVDLYINEVLPAFKHSGVTQHSIVPHNYYFKTWDSSGALYVRDLLTVMPVKPELLDFSKESLLAIDKVIKRKKLPDDVLEGFIFLPAVVGYCGVHLEKDGEEILIDYNEQEDIYEPYYLNSAGDPEFLYIRFYEEASENPRKFSLDEIVEVNFF